MFGLGTGEVLIIFVLALVFIGPKKLPELARSLGKSWREFQRAKDELMAEVHRTDDTKEDNVHAERMKHLDTDLARLEKDKAQDSEATSKESTPSTKES